MKADKKNNRKYEFGLAIFIVVILIMAVFILKNNSSARTDKKTTFNMDAGEEQIVRDIFSGKIKEPPADLGKTKKSLLRAYKYGCYQKEDPEERIDCYEKYYTYKNPGFSEEKKNCELLNGIEKEKCYDNYYFDLAESGGNAFCSGIKDEEKRRSCEELE